MPFWNQKFQYLGYAIGSMKIMFFPTMQSVCQKCWWNFEKAQHAAGGAAGQVQVQVQVQVVQLGIIIIENTDTDTNSTCFK